MARDNSMNATKLGDANLSEASTTVQLGGTRFSRAYAVFEPPWQSKKPAKIDFEIPWGVCRALDALPRIEAVRDKLATLDGAGPFRMPQVDALERCALAAAHMQARYLAATDLEGLLDGAVRRGHAVRELLIANTQVVALHGVITDAEARAFKGQHGYQDIAGELLGLAKLWSCLTKKIEGRTLVTGLHLIEAECYADQLLVAVSALGQEYSDVQVEAMRAERDRLFTLFFECYDPIRAALTFLFHKDDHGTAIAPALSEHDKRQVRLAQLEHAMSYTPREQWDPMWEIEFDELYEAKKK
jgi:hypothetical protein